MFKHVLPLFVFWTTAILSLNSILSLPCSLVSATSAGTSLRTRFGNSTDLYDFLHTDLQNATALSSNSCSDLTTCKNCTNTYTCHWCERSKSCHARGSIHGCAWGNTCKKIKPPKKNNNTCSAQTTCSDCAKVSHFCHWCEHDNACHAVGSRFGCAVGVDCYSNDRCRRSEPEPFPLPSSPIKAVAAAITRVPVVGMVVIAFIGIVCFGCLRCCFCFMANIKGAYDDLTDLTISASVAPISVIGDAHFTQLREFPEEEVIPEEGNEPNNNGDTNNNAESNVSSGNMDDGGGGMVDQPSQTTSQEYEEVPSETAVAQNNSNEHHQQSNQEGNNPYHLMHDTRQNHTDLNNRENETVPLLHPPFNGSTGFEEPRHIKVLFRYCSALYNLSVMMLVLVVGTSLFFYPEVPLYSVCNDELAWRGIMRNIIAFKFDASFEVLASLSNPNRIGAALDRGKGSFSFEGKQFGTFEIPPVTVDPMAVTDFMIIVHISPADKTQAIQLAEAYYVGKLILDANFQGTIRVPALLGYSKGIEVSSIVVDINQASDRSLCRCPTWDDKNHSTPALSQLTEE